MYQLAGVFIKRGGLSPGIVYDQFGPRVVFWWAKFEKVVQFMRKVENDNDIAHSWEWLALRMEKMSL